MVDREYKTVRGFAIAEIVVRKSRFIAYAAPADTAEKALGHISKTRTMHPDARHNVYAYCLREQNAQRHSDDGEPAGTAGLPVLEAIKGEGLIDICVVVTRYFGGTLLGKGGLVRAYSQSAKEGISAAGIITLALCGEFSITVSYPLFDRLSHSLSAKGFLVGAAEYSDEVNIRVFAKKGDESKLLAAAREISHAGSKVQKLGERYMDLELFPESPALPQI